jgi:hypothetical protein
MAPKRNNKPGPRAPPLSQPVVHGWQDQDLSDLSESQIAFLAANPEVDAASVIATVCRNRAAASASAVEPSAQRPSLWSTVNESSDDNTPSSPSIFDKLIKGSVLGKRPQPPSPGPATSLHTDSPARMQVQPPSPPAPVAPVVNWDNYFNNLENALSALRIDHEHTPSYLGTMLTGLQTLLHDERVLSLRINGGFSIADMLDALPRSSSVAGPTPTPVPGIGSTKPVPKPHVKRV